MANEKRPVIHPSRIETDQRTFSVQRLLLDGRLPSEIVRIIAAPTDDGGFGVGKAQARLYIKRAYALIKDDIEVLREDILGEHIAFRRHVRVEAMKDRDFRGALLAADSEAKLLDLFPAAKTKADVTIRASGIPTAEDRAQAEKEFIEWQTKQSSTESNGQSALPTPNTSSAPSAG